MELRDALLQIGEIRRQMARGEVFRGYSAAGTAFTALMAAAAGAVQHFAVPDPVGQSSAYLAVWLAAAVVGLLGAGGAVAVRYFRHESPLERQLTLVAADQFLPSLVAGGLLTWVVAGFVPQAVWMLPGLWAILFSLGLFASRRFLPRAIFLPAGFYLLAGVCCLTLSPAAAMSPWAMSLVFGVGQLMTAAVLYFTLERQERADAPQP